MLARRPTFEKVVLSAVRCRGVSLHLRATDAPAAATAPPPRRERSARAPSSSDGAVGFFFHRSSRAAAFPSSVEALAAEDLFIPFIFIMPSARELETVACMEAARAERDRGGTTQKKCKHPANVEFALFFYKLQHAAQQRGVDAGGHVSNQWAMALGRIATAVTKLPHRIRSLEDANAVTGVGERTLPLFRKYLETYPPDPPTQLELQAEKLAAHAKEAAKAVEAERRKEARAENARRKKRLAAEMEMDEQRARGARATSQNGGGDDDARRATAGHAAGSRGGVHSDRMGDDDDDDDVVVLDDSPRSTGGGTESAPEPWTAGTSHQQRQRQHAAAAAEAAEAEAEAEAEAPPAKRARRATKKTAPWEPGYRTAAFALLATLHRLELQGHGIVTKKQLQDEAEQSGLSSQGIYPRGDSGAANAAPNYRQGEKRFMQYSGWSCFQKQLAQAPRGYDTPLVMTWSNPMKIQLTATGRALAAKMHAAAEARGDCTCGLITAEDIVRLTADADLTEAPPPPAAATRSVTERGVTGRGVQGRPPKTGSGVASDSSTGGHEGGAGVTGEERRPSAAMLAARAAIARARQAAAAEAAMDNGASDACPVEIEVDDRHVFAVPSPAAPVRLCTESQSPATQQWTATPLARAACQNPVKESRLSALGAASSSPPRMPPLLLGERFGDVYDVVLVVDNREQFGRGGGIAAGGGQRNKTELTEELVRRLCEGKNIRGETGRLEAGDAVWVARRRGSEAGAVGDADAGDYVLDVVVERKRLDDLKSSIHDDRYRQQKFFLKRSGLRQLVYLVEGSVRDFEASGVAEHSIKAIKSATVQTEIYDGFQVVRAMNRKEVFDLYGHLTAAITERYANLTAADGAMASGSTDGVDPEPLVPPTLDEYNTRVKNVKRSLATLKTVWGTMLMQVDGLGPDIAQAIIDVYPTPAALHSAYVICGGGKAAAALLADLRTSRTRSVGKTVSERVYTSLFGGSLTPIAQ